MYSLVAQVSMSVDSIYYKHPGSPGAPASAALRCLTSQSDAGALTECSLTPATEGSTFNMSRSFITGLTISLMVVVIVWVIISIVKVTGKKSIQKSEKSPMIIAATRNVVVPRAAETAQVAHVELAAPPTCGSAPTKEPALAPDSKAIDIQTDEQLRSIIGSGKPAVLMVHAPWCGHCKLAMPEFHRASVTCDVDITFAIVDGTKFAQLTKELGITGFPFYALVKNSTPTSMNQHNRRAESIIAAAKTNLNDSSPDPDPEQDCDDDDHAADQETKYGANADSEED